MEHKIGRPIMYEVHPGDRFGRLTVESEPYKLGPTSWVRVRCDCGCKRSVRRGALVTGKVRSCGCLRDELNHQRAVAELNTKIHKGDRVGSLVYLGEYRSTPSLYGNRLKRVIECHMRCDCGNECWVRAALVTSGRRTSCGCRSNAVAASRVNKARRLEAETARRARESGRRSVILARLSDTSLKQRMTVLEMTFDAYGKGTFTLSYPCLGAFKDGRFRAEYIKDLVESVIADVSANHSDVIVDGESIRRYFERW